MAALATLSRLLLALHQAADDLEADALPPAALARLQQDLPFDAAVWASGAATPQGPRFHGLHLMHLPMQMLADYEPLKQHDTLFARCVAQPGRAVCAAASEAPPPLQAHLLRYGLAQAVSIVVLAPTAGLVSGLSLYRRRADRPFDADDVALLEAVYPHLDQAEQRCQLARLHAAARGEPRQAAGAAACDAQGMVRQADPRFLAQLQAEWPGWHGPWLPPPLAALAAAPALATLILRGYGALESAEISALEGLTTLRQLATIASNEVHIKGLATLCGRLERLALSCMSPTTTAMIEAITTTLPGLHALSISLNQGKRTAVPGPVLERLASLSALRWLSMDRNTGLKPEHVDWLGKLPALESLNMNMNEKLAAKLPDILAGCAGLRRAYLGNIPLSDAGLKKLGGLGLEVLIVDSEKLTSKGVAALGGITTLRELSVKSGGLDDAAIKALGRLHELEVLMLKASSPGAVSSLAPLAALPNLRRAALFGLGRASCPDGLLQLASAPALSELTVGGYEEIEDREVAALAASAIRSLRGSAPRAELAAHLHSSPSADTTMFMVGATLFDPGASLEG